MSRRKKRHGWNPSDKNSSNQSNASCGNSNPNQRCLNTVVVPIPVPVPVPVQVPIKVPVSMMQEHVMQEPVVQDPVVQITKHITTEILVQPRNRGIRGVIIYRPSAGAKILLRSVGAKILLRRRKTNQSEGTEEMWQKTETAPCEPQRPQASDRAQGSDRPHDYNRSQKPESQKTDNREPHPQESNCPKQGSKLNEKLNSKLNWGERHVLEALARFYAQQYRAQSKPTQSADVGRSKCNQTNQTNQTITKP